MLKTLFKNKSKNLSGKYSQTLLDHAKKSAADAFKIASNGAVQKIAETAVDLIGNKIASKITKVSKNLQQNNSGIVTKEQDKER